MGAKFDATVQTDQGDYNIHNYFDTDNGCDGVEVFEWWGNSYKYLGNILHVTLAVTDDEEDYHRNEVIICQHIKDYFE